MENLGLEGQWMHPFHDMQSAVSGLAFLWRSLCMCTKECGKTITPLQAAALKRCRAWPRRAHGCTRVPLYDRFTALWTSHGTVCQMSPHLTFYLFCLYFDLFCFCTNLHGEFLFQNPGFWNRNWTIQFVRHHSKTDFCVSCRESSAGHSGKCLRRFNGGMWLEK